jgi:DNA-binding MarR family transcriptional regulator
VTIAHAAERIQFAYPQIYYACHTRHARKRSNAHHLSHRDSAILVHLDRAVPTSLSSLADHMDQSLSTLSEAISKLAAHGYVTKAARAGRDRRQVGIVLTVKGVEAVRSGSVLEAGRLEAVLRRLGARDRTRAIDGFAILARACRPEPRAGAKAGRRGRAASHGG